MMTSQPASARARAQALPSPRLDAQTMAFRPAIPRFMICPLCRASIRGRHRASRGRTGQAGERRVSPFCSNRLISGRPERSIDSGGTMLRDPDSHVVQQAYARWAPVYDALCGPVFLNGRRAAATAAENVGGRIPEIGVGTGLSFEDYDGTTEIVGIDISEPMIARARERI